jgi:hypothetical protein
MQDGLLASERTLGVVRARVRVFVTRRSRPVTSCVEIRPGSSTDAPTLSGGG